MKSLDASQLRQQIAKALNNVAFAGERIAIHRRGKRIAVPVPVDDLELLEAIEDRVDVELAKKSLKEKGRDSLGQRRRKNLVCREFDIFHGAGTRAIADFVTPSRGPLCQSTARG